MYETMGLSHSIPSYSTETYVNKDEDFN